MVDDTNLENQLQSMFEQTLEQKALDVAEKVWEKKFGDTLTLTDIVDH